MTQKIETPPTIITLTLPTPEGGGIAPERVCKLLRVRFDTADRHLHNFRDSA